VKCVHVLRKPCSEGTVAANVLRYGTGAINVDGCRVATDWSDRPDSWKRSGFGTKPTTSMFGSGGTGIDTSKGRWPANLVLQHLNGCVQDGVKKVKMIGATAHRKEHRSQSWVAVGTQPHEHAGFRDPDGTDTVTARVCAPGCPVTGIDQQSGDLPVSRGGGNGYACSIFGTDTSSNRGKGVVGFGDSGGASRFFKQVGGRVPPSGGDHGGSD
jgi:hypothetical protein